jgi:hypothetical protein
MMVVFEEGVWQRMLDASGRLRMPTQVRSRLAHGAVLAIHTFTDDGMR